MNQTDAKLCVTTLGSFVIELNGEPLTDLKTRTAEALLVYLIFNKRPIQREILADFFWDERSQQQAAANFRAVLSRLRRHLGDYLLITRQTVGFDHDQPVWFDAHILEEGLPELLEDEQDNLASLEQLLTLYYGDFLAGFSLPESRGFEEWTRIRRERIRRLAALGLKRLTLEAHRSANYLAGIQWGERWQRVDPWSESVTQQLMWLYARNGQKHLALTAYDKCRQLLERELAISPSPTTQALRQKIAQLTTPPPISLPRYLTPLIGRDAEQETLQTFLLKDFAGIVTIAGMGGSGKSRLAVAVAERVAQLHPGRFLDGIYFIPFVATADEEGFFNQIAGALAIKLAGAKPISEQLSDALADREYLIVLDNLEQLSEEESVIDFIVQWLKIAPATRLIVTSRHRLNLQSERLFTLPGLNYPHAETDEQVDYEAGLLFIERAERAGGAITLQDASPIWRICQAVDGAPLAIELAAGSAGELTTTEISAAISRDIDVLATQMRDVPPRHRSIRAVFNHSWRHLPADEREILAKLSIFAADFAGKAANEITGASLPQLRSLERKSLLKEAGEYRFELHPLIQTFAAEQLMMPAKTAAYHAKFYLDWLADEREPIVSVEQSAALKRVQMEMANIRTAWAWGAQTPDLSRISAAIQTMHTYFVTRGFFVEAEAFFRRAATQIEADLGALESLAGESAVALGRLISRQGWFTYQLSQFDEAQRLMERCRHRFRQLNAPAELAHVLHDEGVLLRRIGEYQAAKRALTESLMLRKREEDGRVIAGTLINLGNTSRMLGEYDAARAHLEEANAILQSHPDPSLLASVANDLGEVARAQGQLEQAAHYYEEALVGYEAVDDTFGKGACHNNLGSVAHLLGEYETAKIHAQKSLALFRETGSNRVVTYPLSVLGRIARDEGDYQEAMAKYGEAYRIADEIGYLPKALDILFEAGTTREKMDELELAVAIFAFLLNHDKFNEETRQKCQKRVAKLATKMDILPGQKMGQNWTLDMAATKILPPTSHR